MASSVIHRLGAVPIPPVILTGLVVMARVAEHLTLRQLSFPALLRPCPDPVRHLLLGVYMVNPEKFCGPTSLTGLT